MTESELTDRLLDNLADSFRDVLPHVREAILQSGLEFAKDTRLELLRWQELLAAGTIDKEDLRWLIQSRSDLARMTALKEAGLTRVRIDELRGKIARIVAGTLIDTVGL